MKANDKSSLETETRQALDRETGRENPEEKTVAPGNRAMRVVLAGAIATLVGACGLILELDEVAFNLYNGFRGNSGESVVYAEPAAPTPASAPVDPREYSFEGFGDVVGAIRPGTNYLDGVAQLRTGDFDGDGDLDVVVGTKMGYLAFFENKIPQAEAE